MVDWNAIALAVPERTGKQCRERYVHHLVPGLQVSEWTPAEDQVIFNQMKVHGTRWIEIAKALPGRCV